MKLDDIALTIYKCEHIAVIGTKEQLDEAAVRYGWSYAYSVQAPPTAMTIAAVNFNTRQIILVLDGQSGLEGIRETIINYSRYGRFYDLGEENKKLEDLFFPEYEWVKPDVNTRVLAENMDRWTRLIEAGFEFSKPSLEVMKSFCESNELYRECALVQTKLDEIDT